MGEMTIRNIDDALLLELRDGARRRGVAVDDLAIDLLRQGLRQSSATRLPVARRLLSHGGRSPISSVELLDQIRDEGL